MAVSQSLTLTEVANSQSIANNSSQVRILWTSTQTGESWNGYTKMANYWVSINGEVGVRHSVSYTLPKNTTKTIVDTVITVPHRDDGTANISVEAVMDTGISAGTIKTYKNLTLTTIARASVPSCITTPNHTRDVGKFGDTIRIHMNRKSTSFTHYVQFSFGTLKGEIATDVADYVDWQIPFELIKEIGSTAKSGWGGIGVETFSNGVSIGSNTVQFEATVPDVEATKPTVNMTLEPVGALPPSFEGLYIQGLTKVKATLSAEGKYGANINSYLMKVDGVLHNSTNAYTSSYLTNSGEKTVYGYATDSREITGETSQKITVIPYSNPKLEGATAIRCDKNGNPSESGTYLKINAKRSYSPCISNGVQKNFCEIHYRYSQDGYNYSPWTTILDGSSLSSDEVTTAPLLGTFSSQKSYVVHIQAIDDVGRTAETFVTLETEKVYMHRDGARNALGLGKYNERDNAVDSDWDIYMNNNQIKGLAEPSEDSDAVPKSYIAADIKLSKELNSQGWYEIGVITGDMCSVTSFILGGVWGWGNGPVSPSMVDIVTYYDKVDDYVRITTPHKYHITKVGIIMHATTHFGVYVYYNHTAPNRVNINVNTRMGGFAKGDWTPVNFTDSDFMKIINLTT